MQKLIKYIILFGIFTLPLINSRIKELLGFSFSMPVSGNYEFTKVMFFNIWSSLVISLFFIQQLLSSFSIKGSNFLLSMNKKGVDYKWLIPLYTILIISTIFSESPIISFLGNNEKSHSFLMWSNLLGLFIVFQNILNKDFFSKTIKTFIFSGIFVSIIGLKEYFFPTFDYGDLGSRIFSTFGHPNYLSIFLVSLIPFLYKKRGIINKVILLLFIITLILTKSFIAIFLFLVFNLYYFGKNIRYKQYIISGLILVLFGLIYTFLPEKLHSFISRYFLWETTFRIIFSDIKIFLIGGGTETLTYFFNNFKSEYVYIFENLGYTADRPHNIIFNFFYHFGIFGLIFISFIYYKIFNYKVGNENIHSLQIKISLMLIFIFILFNPTNIVIYLLITILLANLFIQNNKYSDAPFLLTKRKGFRLGIFWVFILFITIISIFGAYYSYNFYISEIYSYKNNFIKAINTYKYNPELYFIEGNFTKGLEVSKIKNVFYYKYKIRLENNLEKKLIICDEFITKYNYAENYFYCGNIFWDIKKENISKRYYKMGLEKLPDLWNKNSKYYDEFLVKNLKIDEHRLTSKKYGLGIILERLK